jgi:hypothetical protein
MGLAALSQPRAELKVSDEIASSSPALEHVREALHKQMDRSRRALYKMRRGARMFPRCALIPGAITAILMAVQSAYLPILLGLTATAVLLAGGVMYYVGARTLEKAIFKSVESIDSLEDGDRQQLLAEWLA